VELYITELIESGRKITTAERHAFAINHTHRAACLPSPYDDGVRQVIAGARRLLCQMPAQKDPIGLDDLKAMLAAVGTETPIAKRDTALLLFGWATALRRSNLASLQLADLRFTPKGILVWVRNEKQDREGNGRKVVVPWGKRKTTCPVGAIRLWLETRGDWPGPVFCHVMKGVLKPKPMLGNRIAQIVQAAAAKAGLPRQRYGAHSLRAGMATEGLEQGVNEVMIAQQTGHRSLETLRIYLRSRDPFRGNAVSQIGL
jgi:integrase